MKRSLWPIQTLYKGSCNCWTQMILMSIHCSCLVAVLTQVVMGKTFYKNMDWYELIWYKYLSYQDHVSDKGTIPLYQNALSIYPLLWLSPLKTRSWGCLLHSFHKKQPKCIHLCHAILVAFVTCLVRMMLLECHSDLTFENHILYSQLLETHLTYSLQTY